MSIARPQNLLDVDSLIEDFVKKHEQGIATVHRIYFHNNDSLSIRSLVAELMDELRTGCVTFINKNDEMEGLDSYLFYIVNDYCKRKTADQVKKKTEYLCPGCLFFKKENLVVLYNKYFKCEDCEEELKRSSDPKRILFFKTFFKHNKNGYRCADCERFIPHPLDDAPIVSCPYFDCCFAGVWSSLRRMHHPNSESKLEILTLDANRADGRTFKDAVASSTVDAQSQLEIEEELENKVNLLREVMVSQSDNVSYSGSDFTTHHKQLVYRAFVDLLKRYPSEMVSYLLGGSRSGGFQHKVFQEYIRLLEESFPYSFKKNGKRFKVDSLLDENLNLFSGISIFDGIVTDRLVIKNATKEFYIGGRKGSVSEPYYIGKLLNLADKTTKNSLMSCVVEYSFNQIKVKDIVPGTLVTVTHLRVPPHYQMGGMSYVNRVRKKIVERAQLLLDRNIDQS